MLEKLEGQLLLDLIEADKSRTKRDVAKLLGVTPTYLSKIQRVVRLSPEVARAATKIYSLPEGYFGRAVNPALPESDFSEIVALLQSHEIIMKEILNEIKRSRK